jgi:hypothetical protein
LLLHASVDEEAVELKDGLRNGNVGGGEGVVLKIKMKNYE